MAQHESGVEQSSLVQIVEKRRHALILHLEGFRPAASDAEYNRPQPRQPSNTKAVP